MVMELEQFKNIWDQDTALQQKKDDYFLSLLGKPSKSPIARIKRNLRSELIVVIVVYTVGITYYFLAFGGKMAEISWFMLVIGLGFLVYYYFKNRLLNKMQCVSCHVKSNLELQLGTLEKYVRLYLWVGNILLPVTMLFVGYVTIILYPDRLGTPHTPGNEAARAQTITTLLSVTAVLSVGMYFLNKWYLNRLYGRHIKKLKELLKEME